MMVPTSENRCLLRLGTLTCLALLLVAIATTGCGVGGAGNVTAIVAPHSTAIATGRVMGGQQPVTGANITLWQVNTNGSSATAMLQNPVTTDSNGNFTLTGDYPNSNAACTSATQVYVMATGGNPGLTSGTKNDALALMAALGPCSLLTPSTFITVNEVTTVAAVFALQQFLGVSEGTAFAEDIAVGTNSQSAQGMVNAFATAQILATVATGTANATVGNATVEASKINTIANILSTCVNSSGSSSTECQTLFSAVTPQGSIAPGDTIQAALDMAANPSNNIASLYALQTATPPFATSLTSAPYDWTLAITYSNDGLNLPYFLASDGSGNIWITDDASSNQEALVELLPGGVPATGSPFLSGPTVAYDLPYGIAPDTLGNIWVATHGSSSSTGNRLVGFTPGTDTTTVLNAPNGCYPYYLAVDGGNNIFFTCGSIANLYEFPYSSTNQAYASSPTVLGAIGGEAEGMAIDSASNVWVTSETNKTVTEYTASSSYLTAANTFSVGSTPVGVAVDHSNNVWVANGSVVSEFASNGNGTYTSNDFSGGGLNTPRYVAIDGNGNVWVANAGATTLNSTTYVTISEFNNSGLPLTPGNSSIEPGGYAHAVTATSPYPRGITIDLSGNVWMAGCGLSTSCTNTNGSFVLELVGTASPPIAPLATAVVNNQLGCCSFTPVAPAGTAPTEDAGTVSLQAPSYATSQFNGQFAFLVTRTEGFKGPVTVNYATSNGSAIAGTDYTATSGSFTWADGDSSLKTVTVPWLQTQNYSGAKTFNITLTCSSACPSMLGPYNTETVAISAPGTPPSTYFNFNGSAISYYLGLPIDIYGGTGGTNGTEFGWQTVQPTTLAAGFADAYFYLNSSKQVVFTAPSNGATSSPGVGTNDTRSELREYYNGTGSHNQNWTSAEGGTLTGTCYVNATSVDTDEATIGQIHGINQPFVLLKYLPASDSVAVSINTTNTTDSGSTTTTMATGINLNISAINYTLEYSGSTVTVTVNGNTQTFSIDSSWTGTDVYFKLGAYSGAPNTNNPAGDETQVTFSSFSITHP